MWALVVLAALVGLLAVLLAVPVEVAIDGTVGEETSGEARLIWLFGLISVRLHGNGEPGAARRRKRRRRSRRHFSIVRLLRSSGFAGALARYLRRLRTSVKLQLQARATFGLDDPADTGELFGWLQAVGLSAPRGAPSLELWPDFGTTGLRGEARGSIRVVPLRLILETLGFGLSPATWRAVLAARR